MTSASDGEIFFRLYQKNIDIEKLVLDIRVKRNVASSLNVPKLSIFCLYELLIWT
jgi:hypothetical protein